MQFDSSFYRRLKFYLFGFLIGALIVNVLFKGRACRMPATVKLEELCLQKREYTSNVECKMACNKMDTGEVNRILKQGKIDYGKSDVQNTPCGTYVVDGLTKNNLSVHLLIGDCDTISKIMDITLDKDTCRCN